MRYFKPSVVSDVIVLFPIVTFAIIAKLVTLGTFQFDPFIDDVTDWLHSHGFLTD